MTVAWASGFGSQGFGSQKIQMRGKVILLICGNPELTEGMLFPGDFVFSRNHEPRWFNQLGAVPTKRSGFDRLASRS